jgi:hypothetical protein
MDEEKSLNNIKIGLRMMFPKQFGKKVAKQLKIGQNMHMSITFGILQQYIKTMSHCLYC